MELSKVLNFVSEDEKAKKEFEKLPYKATDWGDFIINQKLFENNEFFNVVFQELSNFLNDKPNLRSIFNLFKEFKKEILITLVRNYLKEAIEDYLNLPDEIKKIISDKDYALVEEALKYLENLNF